MLSPLPESAQSHESPPRYQLPCSSLPPYSPGGGCPLSLCTATWHVVLSLLALLNCTCSEAVSWSPRRSPASDRLDCLPCYYWSIGSWQMTFKCFHVNSSCRLSGFLSASVKARLNMRDQLVQYPWMRRQQCKTGDTLSVLWLKEHSFTSPSLWVTAQS